MFLGQVFDGYCCDWDYVGGGLFVVECEVQLVWVDVDVECGVIVEVDV